MTLTEFFKENPRVALGFSGGVDSTYLLYAAVQSGANIGAYYVKTAFQPQFELEDAIEMARFIGIDLNIIEINVLTVPHVTDNPFDRCYYCKIGIFSKIVEKAMADGYQTLIDGTNASDEAGDRPGMKALEELNVRSPLRECGLTKAEIRKRSKEAGLATWDKPAYACLATRIPTGMPITLERLKKTEHAENELRALGFFDFRVRMAGDSAKIQVSVSQFEKVILNRETILERLKPDYKNVLVDLEGR